MSIVGNFLANHGQILIFMKKQGIYSSTYKISLIRLIDWLIFFFCSSVDSDMGDLGNPPGQS